MRPLRVFEAFAGIGAQVKALDKAGIPYKRVGISEWFVNAILSYNAINCANEKEVRLPALDKQIEYLKKFTFSKDSVNPIKNVEKLSEKQINQLYIANKRCKNYGSITELRPETLPTCDLLTYSFPCQDLSTGGKEKGMKKGSGTRSGLLWEVERILRGLAAENRLPKYLLLENVRTLLSDHFRPDLDEWLDVLTDLGYKNSDPVLLSADDYGIPQDRKRCIVVSSLKEKIDLSNLPTDHAYSALDFVFTNYSNPIYRKEADEASLNDTFSRKAMWKMNRRYPLTDKTIFHTITCNLDRSNNAGMLAYSTPNFPNRRYRLLTMREAFLLMGFSQEDYERVRDLGFSYRQINKLIGNSIVVNMLAVVFERMFGEKYGKGSF